MNAEENKKGVEDFFERFSTADVPGAPDLPHDAVVRLAAR